MLISLKNLQLPVSLGVHEWERRGARFVCLSVAVEYDASAAIASDRMEHALDYAALEQAVVQAAQAKHYDLVEALMGAVAEAAFAFPQAVRVTVEVTKPGVLAHCDGPVLAQEFTR